VCEERDKPDVLRRAIHAMNPERALAFVHKNDTAEIVASKLTHHKVATTDLHGAFDKVNRKKVMDDFRSGKARVMIASHVAARGLDIPGVTHILIWMRRRKARPTFTVSGGLRGRGRAGRRFRCLLRRKQGSCGAIRRNSGFG